MSVQVIETDVVIIGAGSAGLVARRAAEASGAKTLLCDGGILGTTCARVGCMPSKLLIAPARQVRSMQNAAAFGIQYAVPAIDGQAVMRRVQKERDRFTRFVVDDIQSLKDDQFLAENVHFVQPGVLESETGTRIHYKAVVLAAGTQPFVPPPFDNLHTTLHTSDTIFEITTLPKRIAVIGAGAIGLELGQAFAALQCNVSIFNHGDALGILRDPITTEPFETALRDELQLYQNTAIQNAKEQDGKAILSWKNKDGGERTENFDIVLVAAGRHANLASLKLAAIQLSEENPRDWNVSPESLQIPNTAVFTAGDINAIRPILHEAADEGRIAGENAAFYAKEGKAAVACYNRRVPLNIAFTYPETATGGTTYQEASQDEETVSASASFNNQGRARVDLENYGALVVYGNAKTKELTGFEMCGPDAEHVAHLLSWMIQRRVPVPDILDMPVYHPVIYEGVRTALQRLSKAMGLRRMSRIRCRECAPTQQD